MNAAARGMNALGLANGEQAAWDAYSALVCRGASKQERDEAFSGWLQAEAKVNAAAREAANQAKEKKKR